MPQPVITVDVGIEDSDPGYRKFLEHLDDSATYVDIGIHPVSGEEMVTIASAHEFGAIAGKNYQTEIPARPFIRSTVDERRDIYAENGKRLWQRILDKEITIFEGLSLLGQLVEGDIRRKIIELREPPNAPSTIARKGSDNPLVDTGAMVNSIRYAVKTKEERVIEMSAEGGYAARTASGKLKKPPETTKRAKKVKPVSSVRSKK